MHTLYIGAHAVGVAVHQHVRHVEATTNPASARARRGIPRGDDAAARLASMEQLAGGYVGTRYSLTMAGQHYEPPSDSERLWQAIATWDVQVHRTLASAPSPANLHLAAHSSRLGYHRCCAPWCGLRRRTRRAGHICAAARPALEHTNTAWTRAADRWPRS